MLKFKVRILKTTFNETNEREITVLNNYFFESEDAAKSFIDDFNKKKKISFANGYVSASNPTCYETPDTLDEAIRMAFSTIKEELAGLNILKLPLLKIEKPSFITKKSISRINSLSHYFRGENKLWRSTRGDSLI